MSSATTDTSSMHFDSAQEQNLEGDVDVSLAPIKGEDTRRSIPQEYFERRPAVFLAKFLLAMAIIGACWAAIALGSGGWLVIIASGVVLGAMYAHLVELQHECLHGHSFKSKAANRLFGFLCGVFMLSSHTHYKHDHLRHHANLGTPRNREFFNYRFENLNSLFGFSYAAFHIGRYFDVFRDILRGAVGLPPKQIANPRDAAKIRTEYQLYGLLIAAAVTYTVLSGNLLFVFAWFVPALLISEAAHFLIELPEHYGLNTQTDSNVLTNTRTINSSWFAQWFTNGNNLHTAHHYHQGVPMAQIPRLHEKEKHSFPVVEESYLGFYKKVLTGEITNNPENCMTR